MYAHTIQEKINVTSTTTYKSRHSEVKKEKSMLACNKNEQNNTNRSSTVLYNGKMCPLEYNDQYVIEILINSHYKGRHQRMLGL